MDTAKITKMSNKELKKMVASKTKEFENLKKKIEELNNMKRIASELENEIEIIDGYRKNKFGDDEIIQPTETPTEDFNEERF